MATTQTQCHPDSKPDVSILAKSRSALEWARGSPRQRAVPLHWYKNAGSLKQGPASSSSNEDTSVSLVLALPSLPSHTKLWGHDTRYQRTPIYQKIETRTSLFTAKSVPWFSFTVEPQYCTSIARDKADSCEVITKYYFCLLMIRQFS